MPVNVIPLDESKGVLIPLTQGQYAIVDAEDYERLSRFNWYARWCPYTNSFYAGRTGYDNGKRVNIHLHHEALGITDPSVRVARKAFGEFAYDGVSTKVKESLCQ
jgi:hypothetical protein